MLIKVEIIILFVDLEALVVDYKSRRKKKIIFYPFYSVAVKEVERLERTSKVSDQELW